MRSILVALTTAMLTGLPVAATAQGIINSYDAMKACEPLTWSRQDQTTRMSPRELDAMNICAGMIRGVNTMMRNNCGTPGHGSVFAMDRHKIKQYPNQGDVEVLAPVFVAWLKKSENRKFATDPAPIGMAKAFQEWAPCRE